jgi:DNA-binding NarL/FixJ family response regulator
MPLRIAVLSDDSRLSDAWVHAISADPVYDATAYTSSPGLRLVIRNANPHAIVIDQQLPGAIETCADLTRGNPRRVVFVNVNQDDDSAMDALASGARGIVYSSAAIEDVVKALHVVDNNQVWAPREVIVATWTRIRTEQEKRAAAEIALAERLSAREREVFRYAAAGLGNKEVASKLSISEATVKVHLTHIFQKLGLRGRGELAAAYHGLLR